MTSKIENISDEYFDNYLEGKSALSQAYQKSAAGEEPPLFVEHAVIQHARGQQSREHVVLTTPKNEGFFANIFNSRWTATFAGAACVLVLGVSLVLQSNLLDQNPWTSKGLAVTDSAIPEKPASQTKPENEPEPEQIAVAAVVTTSVDMATPDTVLPGTEVRSENLAPAGMQLNQPSLAITGEEREEPEPQAMAEASSMTIVAAVDADVSTTQSQSEDDELPVMSPAAQSTAKTLVDTTPIDDAETTDSEDLQQSEVSAAQITDKEDLDSNELERAIENTEDMAESLATTNAELRGQLADLESKFKEAASVVMTRESDAATTAPDNPVGLKSPVGLESPVGPNGSLDDAITTGQPSSTETVGGVSDQFERDNAETMAETVVMAPASEDARVTTMRPSDTPEGRELVILDIPSVRQRLIDVAENKRERFREPLLAVIIRANKVGEIKRAETLLALYLEFYPDAPPLPENLFE